ncbi:hypothetical protein DFH09DRAFT_1307730 [Mycena vulgaris]|nr:hypothetical protein DFH09DRAFT_1307730 [Mycena vulgaris]
MSWTKLGKWLKGPGLVMDIEVDPDVLDAYTKRWALRWRYFQQTFPEASQAHLDAMTGHDEMRSRITWLEGDFARIAEEILRLQEHATDYEILAGSMFLANLIEDSQPDLVSVLKTTKTNPETSRSNDETSTELGRPISQLRAVDRLHMFALRCINEMITRKQLLAAQAGPHWTSRGILRTDDEHESRSSHSAESPVASAVEETGSPNVNWDNYIPFQSMARQPPATETAPTAQSDLLTLRSALPDLRSSRQGASNANARNAPGTLVSSPNSHMKNLTALLGIAFFGASITWSTIFSGARGNLVLISWSACFFIVGTIGAAAASMLVIPEEDIVTVYPLVRWSVRIISLVAMVHVLAGMFLLAIAMLILDPEEDAVRGGRRGTQSAGGYAISASAALVIVAGTVWRRHTRRTWFL